MSALANWTVAMNSLTRPFIDGCRYRPKRSTPEVSFKHFRSAGQESSSSLSTRSTGAWPKQSSTRLLWQLQRLKSALPQRRTCPKRCRDQSRDPACCGMPQLEQAHRGRRGECPKGCRRTQPLDEKDDVIALVPSCALMMKFEWPLILPEDESVKTLSEASFDITEYIVDIAKKDGLARPVAT